MQVWRAPLPGAWEFEAVAKCILENGPKVQSQKMFVNEWKNRYPLK